MRASYDQIKISHTEQKPRNTEFPLDQILPAFNLNRPDPSQYAPTIKNKTIKDNAQVKDRRGVIKGSTINSGSMLGKKPMDLIGYGHLRTQPSQALLNPVLNKVGAGQATNSTLTNLPHSRRGD